MLIKVIPLEVCSLSAQTIIVLCILLPNTVSFFQHLLLAQVIIEITSYPPINRNVWINWNLIKLTKFHYMHRYATISTFWIPLDHILYPEYHLIRCRRYKKDQRLDIKLGWSISFPSTVFTRPYSVYFIFIDHRDLA